VTSAFNRAIQATPRLAGAYRPGLRALRTVDRERVSCRDGRRLTGSINLEEAVRASHPSAKRWDYGIGIKAKTNHVVWVEVHPASSKHIQDVIGKLSWLREWLKTEAPALRRLPPIFVWVASGRVAIPPTSAQRRTVAKAGIHFAGEWVQVDALLNNSVPRFESGRRERP
jgi:hypothetical protein